MITYDDQAGVFGVRSDDGAVWIGAYDTYGEARDALLEYRWRFANDDEG